MNRIITFAFLCIVAVSLSCREGTVGLPVSRPDRNGVLEDGPSGREKVTFHVIGLMKTKSGAT